MVDVGFQFIIIQPQLLNARVICMCPTHSHNFFFVYFMAMFFLSYLMTCTICILAKDWDQ